jgi:phage shock protein E
MAHPRSRTPKPLIPALANQIAALDKNATYAVYCRSGNRSGTALEQMTAAGFTHVYDLAGGIGTWQSMGGP